MRLHDCPSLFWHCAAAPAYESNKSVVYLSLAGDGLLGVADRTAGLLFARLLLPDATAPVLPLLAGAHCAAAALRLATRVLRPYAPRRAGKRLHVLRRRSPLLGAVAAGAERLGGAAARYGEPAGLLLLLAAAWVALHPTSAQLAEAMATLVPVLLGYSQTARHCARKQLPASDMEAAWHARHKWAARRCAHLLGDLPERPPLAGLMDACQGLCLSIGVAVNGRAFGGTNSEGGWIASSEAAGWSAWGSVRLDGSVGSSREAGGEQRQQLQPPQQEQCAAPVLAPREQQQRTSPMQPEAAPLPGTLGQHQLLGPMPGVLDSPSELCGPLASVKHMRRNHWQEHDWPEGEAAASGSGATAWQQDEDSSSIDFMHPSSWANARSQGEIAERRGSDASSSSVLPSFILSDHSNSSYTASESGAEDAALLPAGHEAVSASPRAPLRPTAAAGLREVAAVAAATGGEPVGALSPTSGMQSPLCVESPGHACVGGVDSASCASTWQEGSPASGAEVVGEPYSELAAEDPPLAALYGHADHMLDVHTLTPAEMLGLVLRALHLGLLFAPFVLFGGLMLLLASHLSPSSSSYLGVRPGRGDQLPSRAASAAAHLRRASWSLLLWACRHGGAAMIKWGQWSSTREDVFPEVSAAFNCTTFLSP